jgi:hypothetical protein
MSQLGGRRAYRSRIGDDSCPGESQHFIAQLETTREDKFGDERDDLMEQQEEERQAGLQDGPISASFN